MTTKRVEVASTDSRRFVQALLELGAQGAVLPEDCGVFKGIMLRTRVEVAEDVAVNESNVVRVLPQEKEKASAKPVINTQVVNAHVEPKSKAHVAKKAKKAADAVEAPKQESKESEE